VSESVVVLNPFLKTEVASGSSSLGAFGRLRVGNPFTLWDSQFQYSKCPELWFEETQGAGSSGTHLPDESAIEFAVDTGASDFVIRQSRNYLRYKPGKSQLVFISGNLGGQQAGQFRRMGYFDDENGVFIELDGTDINIVLRSNVTGSVVDTKIAQADWNLDKFDGTGGSSLTFDSTKVQIFIVDLEWLGVGTVRAGFVINGKIIYAHAFQHANVITTTYMTTANLPIRYETRNFAALGGASSGFKQICSTVISEGGEGTQVPDQIRAASTDLGTPVSVTDANMVPVISIRLKDLINGIDNRGLIEPISFDILVVAAKNVAWELRINPTINPTSWLSTDSQSIAEYNLDATTISAGRRIASGFASGQNQSKGFTPFQVDAKIKLARNFDNTDSDIATLAFRSLDTPSSDVFTSLQWSEFAC